MNNLLLMLDLYCGINGASMAMRERKDRWRVIGVDLVNVNKKNNFSDRPERAPTVLADVRALPFDNLPRIDFLWASPPCTYYSRHDMKHVYKDEPEPDHTLFQAAYDAIERFKPRHWAIENVRGAQRFWGKATAHFGSVYIWTNVPLGFAYMPLDVGKWHMSGRDAYLRSETPREVSTIFADKVEELA